MEHFTRIRDDSIIDAALEIAVCERPPDPAASGVSEISATIPQSDSATGVVTGIEHCWLRSPGETERDFTRMALAAARRLGLHAVVFTGIAAVPPAEEYHA
jgi:hypothetical protein